LPVRTKESDMKKSLTLLVPVFFAMTSFSQTAGFYDFRVKTIEGADFDFDSLRGKKVMIVNTASKCGYTPQYKDLQELHEMYGDKLVILGFPANNFANQEPGTAAQIREFCTENYGVTFLMMDKISVKGKNIHPLYVWLTSKEKNGVMDSEVKWNFQKYLVSGNGQLVDVLYSKEKPGSEKVLSWLSEK